MAKKKGEAPIKKTDAVKQALAAGVDAPSDAVGYIKEKFGIDITPQQFSTYKSLAKAKGGGRRKKVRRAARLSGAGDVVGNGLVAVKDLEAVKHLVDKVGADQVKRIAGLFE